MAASATFENLQGVLEQMPSARWPIGVISAPFRAFGVRSEPENPNTLHHLRN